MKILEQKSPTTFLVESEPLTDEQKRHHMVIAHDYINFFGWKYISTKGNLMLKTPNGGGTNILQVQTNMQINIAEFAGIFLPEINAAKEMQPEHFKNYIYKNKTVTYYKGRVRMISFFENGEVVSMPLSTYEKIKKGEL